MFHAITNVVNGIIYQYLYKEKYIDLFVFSRIKIMSMITFGICALFFISTISALPAPGSSLYSAVIENKQNAPIQCTISWESRNGPLPNKDTITIDSMESSIVNERDIDMGTWTAAAIIKTIECGDLVLNAPFQGVVSIQRLWKFSVEPNNIVSVGPNSKKP